MEVDKGILKLFKKWYEEGEWSYEAAAVLTLCQMLVERTQLSPEHPIVVEICGRTGCTISED